MISDFDYKNYSIVVSVPIWGLFNLTKRKREDEKLLKQNRVSVPIWGLFNLTLKRELYNARKNVSVPIWGLFNLTLSLKQ